MREQKNSGITLIGLIVTIIVLLILAGVAISVLVGENGILNQAKNAKDVTSVAEAEEKLKLLKHETYIEENIDVKTSLTDADPEIANWRMSAREKWLVGYLGTDAEVYVPTHIRGEAATEININCFNSNTNIKKVVTSVPSLGDGSFSGCTNLEKLILKDGVIGIKQGVISRCRKIEYLIIPSTVTNISQNAFVSSGLKSIVIPESVTSIGAALFAGCSNPIKVFCEADSKPEGWSDDWLNLAPEGTTVEWGYNK